MKTRMKVPINKFHDDNEVIFYFPKELGEHNDYEHSTIKWFVNQWMDDFLDNFYIKDKEIFGFAGDLKTMKFLLMNMIEEYLVKWNKTMGNDANQIPS